MARRRRYLPGAIYHVMLCGDGGECIFFQDEDRCRMCFLIQEGIKDRKFNGVWVFRLA